MPDFILLISLWVLCAISPNTRPRATWYPDRSRLLFKLQYEMESRPVVFAISITKPINTGNSGRNHTHKTNGSLLHIHRFSIAYPMTLTCVWSGSEAASYSLGLNISLPSPFPANWFQKHNLQPIPDGFNLTFSRYFTLGKRWLNRYRISFLYFYLMQGISRRE